jgi:hypothetical protein
MSEKPCTCICCQLLYQVLRVGVLPAQERQAWVSAGWPAASRGALTKGGSCRRARWNRQHTCQVIRQVFAPLERVHASTVVEFAIALFVVRLAAEGLAVRRVAPPPRRGAAPWLGQLHASHMQQ